MMITGRRCRIIDLHMHTDDAELQTGPTDLQNSGYREWIIENLTNKYMRESKSIGINRIKEAKGNAQLTLWASMMKSLDSAKGISWRLWSRMLTETLPTNHKLSRMAESNSDNIYKWVYREELGKEGGCRRKGCTEESETTDHAICGCRWAQEKWEHLDAQLEREWALKGWDWSKVSWIANKYEGWERLWTAAGGVPRGIESIIGSEFSPQMHSKIMEAAGRCARTAQEIWKERNEENEEWLDSIPDLRERKTEAGRRQWRHAAQPKEKVHRKRTRVNQKKADREEHKKRVVGEVTEKMEQWEVTVNAYREERRMLRIGPEELGREAKRVRAEDVKEVMKAHREEVKKAVYAGSTPDIDMSEVATTDMMNTTPVTSSKRTRGTDAHFWVPKANTEVRVFWAGIEGGGEHNKVKGTWHSARTTNMEWPEEKGIPGVYLEYTDGVVEWTAMDLFGDTVQIIPTKTKKMKHNQKNKKRKQDQAPGYTETFPAEATEWLGYGSLVKVKFKSEWCPGQVIGRGAKGILVQYSDGVGEHDDLHSRGCRVKVFRRRVDMDALYDSTPWMRCPFDENDEACICRRCSTEKWPGRYSSWNLSEEQISEAKSIEPEKRKEWVEIHVIGEHLFAEGENGDNAIRCDVGSRRLAAQGNEDEDGQDEDQENTRGQTAGLECEDERHRQAKSRHSMGLRSGDDHDEAAHQQGHGAHNESPRTAEGERESGTRGGAAGRSPQGRAAGIDRDLAEGERGEEGRPAVPSETRQAEPTEGSQTEDTEQQRQGSSTDGDHDAAGSRRDSDATENTEQREEEGEVEQVDRGLSGVDGGGGVDHRRRKRGAGEEGEADSEQVRDSRRARTTSAESGRRVEVDSQSGTEILPDGESGRSGQEGVHMDGVRGGVHHSGGDARLDAEELSGGQRPDHSAVQKGGGAGGSVGRNRPRAGVHPVQHGERSEREQRMHARQASRLASEPGEHDTRETGKGEGGLCTGEGGGGDPTSVAGATPRSGIPPGEPLRVRALVPARGDRDHSEEPGVGDQGNRPVCLRAEGEEADQDNDEQASVDPERENRKRAVQGGKMHWLADAKRADGAPRSDVPEQQREGSRHGGQKRRAQREGAEGGQERAGGRTHRGNVQDDSIDARVGPCGVI